MAFSTPIAHLEEGSSNQFTFTTSAIDTTGADFLVAYVSELESVGNSVLTDSKGNTWQTDITEQKDVATASLLGRMFYVKNPTVGSGHTFTVTDTSGGCRASIAVAAFSGGHLTAPLDQQNGKVDIDAGLSNTTNAITPSEGSCLIITGLAFSGGSAGNTITIDSSFTKIGQVDLDANHKGVALAYLIETSVVAQNPTWTYTNNQYVVATIASFKAAAGGGGGGTPTRNLTTLLSGQ